MDLSVLGVFAAGLATFFSPCILPMAPIIVANYILNKDASKLARIVSIFLFSLGFIFTFSLMGLSLPWLAHSLGVFKPLLLFASGFVMVIYGFKMIGFFQELKIFRWTERTFHLPDFRKRVPSQLHGFLFGATFGLAWTPCVGPVLGGVLTYVVSKDRSVFESLELLISFALGILAPFVLISLSETNFKKYFSNFKKYLPKMEYATGVALIIFGFWIFTHESLPRFQNSKIESEVAQIKFEGDGQPIQALDAPKIAGNKVLFFYSKNCPICHAMEAFLPEIEKDCQSKDLQFIRIDVDKPQNAEIANQFQIHAVPTTSFLTSEIKEIAHLTGYQTESSLRDSIATLGKVACSAPSNLKTTPQEKLYQEGLACHEGEKC